MKQDKWIDCNMNPKHKTIPISGSELLRDDSLLHAYFYNFTQELVFAIKILGEKEILQ